MKLHKRKLAVVLLLTGASLMFAGTSKHSASKDTSTLTYVLIHPLHRIEGTSKEVTCEIEYDDATHTVLQASFSADLISFDSGNSNRDSHALETLEALMYPTVSFRSTDITTHAMDLNVKGELTFHGRTKPMSFVATAEESGDGLKITGSAKVSLTEFEIERPSLLMIPVKDTLSISFSLTFPTVR